MTLDEKLNISHALKDLGIDVIEAGFPIASPGDHKAVTEIAKQVKGPVICALARCKEEDIDRAWDAVRHSTNPRLHVFLATSKIHQEAQGIRGSDLVERVRRSVRKAKSLCDNVEFSPEDAYRSDVDFICEVLNVAVEEGSTVLNIPDTVGYATPEQIKRVLAQIKTRVPMNGVELSTHCHNDLGLAVANSLAAVEEGINQIECTINGIGERAGNCALEELVMALEVRKDFYKAVTGINTELLVPTSKLVQEATYPVHRHKAIDGENVFADLSGIHGAKQLKNKNSYRVMQPETVGWDNESLPLGKHSGINMIYAHLDRFGLPHCKQHSERFRVRYKEYADAKVEAHAKDQLVSDEELIEHVYLPVVREIMNEVNGGDIVKDWKRIDDVDKCASVEVRFRDDKVYSGTASGEDKGIIDALVKALKKKYPGTNIPEKGFNVITDSSGSDMPACVHIKLANVYSGFTVMLSQKGAKMEEVQPASIVSAFNALYAVQEYADYIVRLETRTSTPQSLQIFPPSNSEQP